jgi:hypothetical protein
MVVDRNAEDEMIETTDCWQPGHHGLAPNPANASAACLRYDLVPSSTGLHIAAYARRASVDHIDAIASRASDLGVAIQPFQVGEEPRASYWDMGRSRRREGLRRLCRCFDECLARRPKAA